MNQWNNSFPVDLWWRRHFKIPYGSEQHLQISLPEQLFDYLQHKAIEKAVNREQDEINANVEVEVTDEGEVKYREFGDSVEMTEEELEEYYNDIDLDEEDE